MTFYLCVSGCGRYLAPRDGHERCFACLGLAHAEAAFVDESCTHCGMMTVSELRSRLQLLQRGGVPVPLPRSNPPQRVAASGDTGDLRITVSAFPSGNQRPRKPHSSCTPQPAELPEERGGPSQRCAPSVSFGAPLDDRMSIAASEGESDFAGDDASAQLSPSGTVAVPDTDPEMMAMLSRAANRVGLMWNPPPCPEPSRLDDWFLETAPVGPPPSPPFMAVRLRVTRTSPLWSGPWLCSCALTPPGAGSRLSLPGPVSTRRTLPAGLTRPVGKPPPPYTLWRCCRSIRPRHWETCTRVVMTHKFITNFVLRRTSHFGRRRLRRGQWAVWCPLWWSRNAISGCVWPTWGIPTKSGSLIPPCPRPASLATRSRTSPSSSRLYRSSLKRLATSCPGGPLLHPLCRRQHLSLLVAEGDPLRLPPLPRRSNSLHPSGAVEPVVSGVPSPSRPPPRGRQSQEQEALGRATRRWLGLLFRRWWLHRSFPRRRAGW